MAASAVNSLVHVAPKPPLIDRTQHYHGPSGSIHHFHSHSKSSGGKKRSIALTALTLLSFLFFLNILQNCIQEHMDSMTMATPQVVIMQAMQATRLKELREIEAQNRKGELQSNGSLGKESRTNPETSKPKTQLMTQIPVKLRTNEKAAFRP